MSILFYLLSIQILAGMLMVYQFFLTNKKNDAYTRRNRRK
jgi:nitrogen fixation-related uncharacterized protein